MKIDLNGLLSNIAMDVNDTSDIINAFVEHMTNEQLINVAKILNKNENLNIPYFTDSWLNDIKETIVDIVKDRAYDWAAIQYEDIQGETPSLTDYTFDEALHDNVCELLTCLREKYSNHDGYVNFIDIEDISNEIDNFYDDGSAIECLTYIVNYIFENNDIIDIIKGNVKNYPTTIEPFDSIVFEGGIDYETNNVTVTNNDYLI